MTIEITTTTADYDFQLEAATAMLRSRLEAAIGDDQFLVEQLHKSLDDALNNTWHEGIPVRKWAERAAKLIGI